MKKKLIKSFVAAGLIAAFGLTSVFADSSKDKGNGNDGCQIGLEGHKNSNEHKIEFMNTNEFEAYCIANGLSFNKMSNNDNSNGWITYHIYKDGKQIEVVHVRGQKDKPVVPEESNKPDKPTDPTPEDPAVDPEPENKCYIGCLPWHIGGELNEHRLKYIDKDWFESICEINGYNYKQIGDKDSEGWYTYYIYDNNGNRVEIVYAKGKEIEPIDPAEPENPNPEPKPEPEEPKDPVVPEEPDKEDPKDPEEEPKDPVIPEEPKPDEPAIPDEPDEEDPEVPEEPDKEDPIDPVIPEKPDKPNKEEPKDPVIPDDPKEPEKEVPEDPEPVEPITPEVPDKEDPKEPEKEDPEEPAVPKVPDKEVPQPVVPEQSKVLDKSIKENKQKEVVNEEVKSDNPKTGDSENVAVVAATGIGALLLLGIVSYFKKE